MNNTQDRIDELRAKIDELEASLKEDKFEYPICKKDRDSDLLVLFTGLNSGKIIRDNEIFEKGDFSDTWAKHTHTGEWEDYPYDKKRGLYHKQMVYCWDNNDTHAVHIRFYNAIKKCAFPFNGSHFGISFHNYSTTMPDFLKEAYKTLKD
jgi:hypothetical protein